MSSHLQNVRDEHRELIFHLEEQIRDAVGKLSFYRVSYGVDPDEEPDNDLRMSWKVTDPQFTLLAGCFIWWLGGVWVLSNRPRPVKLATNECFADPNSAIQTWVARTRDQLERELHVLTQQEVHIAWGEHY